MYESFYGLNEKPFTLLPDPDYLYLSPKHQRALTLLEYGVMNKAGFSVICGDTGAGKTTLIRRLLSELTDETTVGLITNTHRSFGELLNWVLMAFGLDAENKTKSQMHQMFIEFLVTQYAKNKHTILIVDEAQNMEAETLEELRMLSNINADKDQVLQVILAGQPALKDTLRKPELMQFAQRIAVDYYLEALNRDETAMYIHHRLKVAGAEEQIFSSDACDAVYRYSGGTPRLINLLCDTSLVYAFAEQLKVIDSRLIDDVVREQHSNSILPTFNAPHKIEAESKEKNKADAAMADLGDRVRKAVSNNEEEVKAVRSDQWQAVDDVDKTQSVEEIKKSIKDLQDIISGLAKDSAVAQQEPGIIENSVPDSSEIVDPDETVCIPDEPPAAIGEAEEDIYPIVHVEERHVKASPGSVLFVGLASGMLVATIAILVVGYMLFGDELKGSNKQDAISIEIQDRQAEVERKKIEAMARERDAALALTKAMERERDAAITATRVQEEIRKAEQRAAELIAEQERKASLEVMRAKKRAQQAEYEAARSKESERQAREDARKAKLKAEELHKKQLEDEARAVAAAKKEERQPVVKDDGLNPVINKPVIIDVVDNSKLKEATKKEAGVAKSSNEFSANPCNSPSAKFLSTCKK
ncbi:MAG: AAA family ATPase [Gammaproteobacteria bacterium]|nr:AAA family ATPase [Gammaproteobacteria bacterium]